jgi:hypothetical protein
MGAGVGRGDPEAEVLLADLGATLCAQLVEAVPGWVERQVVVRDAFEEARFPDDLYGLTPASLGAVDPSLTDAARAWGAAKAMAHKARHRDAGA